MIQHGPTTTVVSGMDPDGDGFKKLVKTLHVYDESAEFPLVRWTAVREIRGSEVSIAIPRGYPEAKLRSLVGDHEVGTSILPIEARPGRIKCFTDPLNALQADALSFLRGSGKWTYLVGAGQRVLALQTGVGKTYCILRHASDSGLFPIVIFHKEALVRKWMEDIAKFTDVAADEVAYLSGKDSLRRIAGRRAKTKIVLAIHRTLSNLTEDEETKDEVASFFAHMGFGLRVYDEAHLEQRAVFLLDSLVQTAETVYLTATPARTDRSADRIFSWMLPRKEACFGNQPWLKRERYHDVMYATFNSRPPAKWLMRMAMNKHGMNAVIFSQYMEQVTYPIYRNAVLRYVGAILAKKPGAMIVVLALLNSTAARFHADLSAAFPEIRVGLYNGSVTDPIKRASQLDMQVVVSNDKMMKEGNDCAMEALINTIPMSSEVGLEQVIGRLRGGEGRKAVYVELVDLGFVRSKAQFLKRKKFINGILARQHAERDLTGEAWAWEGMQNDVTSKIVKDIV